MPRPKLTKDEFPAYVRLFMRRLRAEAKELGLRSGETTFSNSRCPGVKGKLKGSQ